MLKQKLAPKGDIILNYFILSKNHNDPPKVAQLAKKLPKLVTLALTDFFKIIKLALQQEDLLDNSLTSTQVQRIGEG